MEGWVSGTTFYLQTALWGFGRAGQSHLLWCHLASHQDDFYLALPILFLSSSSQTPSQTPGLESDLTAGVSPLRSPGILQVNCKIEAWLVVSRGI